MQPQLIASDPEIMMGKPVVIGTRITVELILEKLAAGETYCEGESFAVQTWMIFD